MYVVKTSLFCQRLLPRNVFPGYREVMIFQQVFFCRKILFSTTLTTLSYTKDSLFRGTCGTVSWQVETSFNTSSSFARELRWPFLFQLVDVWLCRLFIALILISAGWVVFETGSYVDCALQPQSAWLFLLCLADSRETQGGLKKIQNRIVNILTY